MIVQGLLIGAEDPIRGENDKGKYAFQNVHVAMDGDKPRCGKVVMSGGVNPDDFIAGATPEKFPRPCKIGLQVDAKRPARIVSITCE